MDVSDEILDQEACLFYENVRALVVVFLTVSVLLVLSYIIVVSRRKYKEPCLSKDDVYVHSFVMGICTATMALSIIMLFMLPLSILANEVLILFPDCYYVQWISAGLLHTFFVFVQVAFKGTCILIPFGFFFLSSHSVYTGSKAVSSRFFYSILYLAITYLASFGILTTFLSTFALTFRLSNITSATDLLVSIIIQMMKVSTAQSLRSLSNDVYFRQLMDEKYHLQLEGCLNYIENLNEPLRHLFSSQFDKLNYQTHSCSSVDTHYHLSSWEPDDSFGIDALSCNLKQASPRTGCSLLSSLAFLFLLSVLLAAALYASINVIVLLCHLLVSRTYEMAEHSSRDAILLGHESASKFGFIGASLQVCWISNTNEYLTCIELLLSGYKMGSRFSIFVFCYCVIHAYPPLVVKCNSDVN
ncbi:unnamed protein product [Hydatigera taeniaeformis]|uniref:Protein LMBR1L n=1 Tax=Hydatigena taeniaeformis TaxID=6205 RepID=A0A0R3WLW6_HYDTA|nr:unnamed protein product [Hydatigera taeniaeformis]